MKWSATAALWFSNFLEKALVRHVKRRIDIRMVRFCRSTKHVLTCLASGLPLTTFMSVPMHFAGE